MKITDSEKRRRVALTIARNKAMRDLIKRIERQGEVFSWELKEDMPSFMVDNKWLVDLASWTGFIEYTPTIGYNPTVDRRTRMASFKPGKNFDAVVKIIDVLEEIK